MAKYVVISDPHLGQTGADRRGQFSLLSRPAPHLEPEQARVAAGAVSRLRRRVARFAAGDGVTLIVAGDLLDLSLAFLDDALEDLAFLLGQLREVERLVWVVGNHDHHVWMMHSEERRTLSALRRGELPAAGGVYRPTGPDGEPFELVTPFLRRALGRDGFEVTIAYPAYRLTLIDPRADLPPHAREVQFYFTHGHLFGGLYTILSKVLEDRLPGASLESMAATVNLSIVELVYWLLGETGEGFGADGLVESVYIDFQKGESSLARALVAHAVDTLLPDGVIAGIPDTWERGAIAKVAYELLKKACADVRPSASIDRYRAVEETRRLTADWAVRRARLSSGGRVTLVYGHTHVADEHPVDSTAIEGFNLGSWLVEPGCDEPDARVLLIDDGAPLEVSPERV